MSTRGFLLSTLTVPILFGLLGFATPLMGIFQAALLFGGVPYIPFACLLGIQIWRARTKQRLAVISLLAPIVFAVCESAFVAVVGSSDGTRGLTLGQNLDQLAPIAAYSLAFGYFYVLLAWCLWLVARKRNLVVDELAA
jgi:hypothetical protein